MKVMHVLRVKTNFFWDSLNVIRASILGANDGIISVSGIVLGAAGANLDSKTLLISGLSGMLAGACSMAGGEWISVSTQRDIQEKTMERQLENEDCENCPIKLQKNDILMPFHAAASSFCSIYNWGNDSIIDDDPSKARTSRGIYINCDDCLIIN